MLENWRFCSQSRYSKKWLLKLTYTQNIIIKGNINPLITNIAFKRIVQSKLYALIGMKMDVNLCETEPVQRCTNIKENKEHFMLFFLWNTRFHEYSRICEVHPVSEETALCEIEKAIKDKIIFRSHFCLMNHIWLYRYCCDFTRDFISSSIYHKTKINDVTFLSPPDNFLINCWWFHPLSQNLITRQHSLRNVGVIVEICPPDDGCLFTLNWMNLDKQKLA